MGALEQITQMKQEGISEEEIVTRLKEQKFSPREINDALNQSQIKNAVSNRGAERMEPSTTQEASSPQQQYEGVYAPRSEEIPSPQQEVYAPSPTPEGYSQEPGGELYEPRGYGGYGYAQEGGTSTDTIIEIAEQVFSEKIKKIQKKMAELSEFKTLYQAKIENALERIKRIETTIDKLQIAILEKIGSYGKTLQEIKKEMSMMQNSFGKMVSRKSPPKQSLKRKKH